METCLDSKWLNYTRIRNKVKTVTRRAQIVREMEVEGKAKESKKLFLDFVIENENTILFIGDRDPSNGMAVSGKQKAGVLSQFDSSFFLQRR